ncbi:MAG: tRNA (adenosine(37)-N6)-threonylcarbamoyltransferase complex dimerization subunit type 1 TsaB [Candidatus Aegiribacteria sp.]|nr:tRNA (adenosine(37)-N6)-threonylcarbamoyltransferase complex dimerization subunit type 1 TsaB [Candidatus Aegiribacteria sp.]
MTGVWLGIETTTSTGGVAVMKNGVLLAEEYFPVRATHSEKVLPGIAKLMKQTEVGSEEIVGIAVSSGPGSYTGLRIGIATAHGLSAGWGIGAVGVETLRVLAVSVTAEYPVLSCISARSNEVFAAVYENSSFDAAAIVPPGIYTASAIENRIAELDEVMVVGSGRNVLSFPERVIMTDPLRDTPRPSIVALLGSLKMELYGFDDKPTPVYLRGFNEKAEINVP